MKIGTTIINNDEMRKYKNLVKILILQVFCSLFLTAGIFAQEINISGKVSETSGAEIPGVNVVIKGTTNGTITDLDGNYQLTVPGKDVVLQFSFVGFTTKEVTVGDRTVINVTLETEAIGIDDVVVVGYGTQKKSDVTGSIVSVDSEKLLSRPVTQVSEALQAQAAGVQIAATSGMPGDGPSVRIRGHGGLTTSNAPLWVIDGFIGGEINSIAPEDIESIEVLKDASAAIYGARAANGVILVTTKRGKKNSNSINFSYYRKLSNISKKVDVLNSSEWMTLRNRALTNDNIAPLFTQRQIDGLDSINGYIADTDWQDEIFRTAVTDYFNLSFSGGGDKTTYAISANQQNIEGAIVGSDFKRSGARVNLDHTISNKLKIGLSTNIYRTEQNRFNVGGGWNYGAAGAAITSPPYYPVKDSTGQYYRQKTWDNPFLMATLDEDKNLRTTVTGNLYVMYEPIKGLSLRGDISGSNRNSERRRFVSGQLYGATATRGIPRANLTRTTFDKYIGTVTASYEKKFMDIHNVTALVGSEQEVDNSFSTGIFVEKIDREAIKYYNIELFDEAYTSINSGASKVVFKSHFSRLTYSLMDKYRLQYTFRLDGSSRFGPNYQWGKFHSISGAWNIDREDFMQSVKKISSLKLRMSWGQSGKDDIDNYKWMPKISGGYASYLFGGIDSPGGEKVYVGQSISDAINTQIHWEVGITQNIGVDFGLLEDRITGSFEVYNRITKDLLYDKGLPYLSGYGTGWTGGPAVTTNVAKMQNRGLEMQLGVNILNSEFKWDVDANLTINRNKVLKLADGNPFNVGRNGVIHVEEGKPLGNVYGYYTDGLFQEGDDIKNTVTFYGDEEPGDQRYIDANKDGQLTSADMGLIGNALPNYIIGAVSTMEYKGLRLTAIINCVQGVDLYNVSRQVLSNGQLGEENGGAWLLDSWTPENPNTDIPRMTDGFVDEDKSQDRFMEDASYLKIANVELAYSLPQFMLQKMKLKNLMVYVSLQNYFTFTKYTGYDPEVYTTSNGTTTNIGLDNQGYPTPKSITMGVKIGI